jgi:membrane-associated phospholipid phosphatase
MTDRARNTTQPIFPKIISYVFHPLLMPTYGLLLYFMVDNTAAYFMKPGLKWVLIGMTFAFTFLLPFLNALFLLRSRYIKSLHMETKEERKMPLVMTAFFFAAEYWMLHDRAVPETLKMLLLSGTISITLTVIINLFWKISAHMVGIGGVTGAMFVLAYLVKYPGAAWLMIILLFLAGLIGMARLQLKAHTPMEVLGGFVLGAGCPLLFLAVP